MSKQEKRERSLDAADVAFGMLVWLGSAVLLVGVGLGVW